MLYGFALFNLSYTDIKEEEKAAREAAKAAAEEAAAAEGEGAGEAGAEGEEGGVKIDYDKDPSPLELIMGASGAQKINFANNLMVFLGQGLKNVFDSVAAKQLEQVI